jgi:hypothetical protein
MVGQTQRRAARYTVRSSLLGVMGPNAEISLVLMLARRRNTNQGPHRA